MPATVQTLGIALLATVGASATSGPSRSGRWTRARLWSASSPGPWTATSAS